MVTASISRESKKMRVTGILESVGLHGLLHDSLLNDTAFV